MSSFTMDQEGEGEQISFTVSQAHKRQFEKLNWFPLPSLQGRDTSASGDIPRGECWGMRRGAEVAWVAGDGELEGEQGPEDNCECVLLLSDGGLIPPDGLMGPPMGGLLLRMF
jgi:hypothetical protein